MKIDFKLNGSDITIDTPPFRMFIDILRIDLGLTGTKKGCGTGSCGSCLAIVNGKALNTCLLPAFRLEQANIVTIEGFAATKEFRIIADAFARSGVTLCGACAPGIVMATEALLMNNLAPTLADIKTAISGNTCRCIGYLSLVAGIQEAARQRRKNEYVRKR